MINLKSRLERARQGPSFFLLPPRANRFLVPPCTYLFLVVFSDVHPHEDAKHTRAHTRKHASPTVASGVHRYPLFLLNWRTERTSAATRYFFFFFFGLHRGTQPFVKQNKIIDKIARKYIIRRVGTFSDIALIF